MKYQLKPYQVALLILAILLIALSTCLEQRHNANEERVTREWLNKE